LAISRFAYASAREQDDGELLQAVSPRRPAIDPATAPRSPEDLRREAPATLRRAVDILERHATADEVIAYKDSPAPPPSVSVPLAEHVLRCWEARCWAALSPTRGVALYDAVLRDWPRGRTRDGGLYLARLARACADAGELDRARAEAAEHSPSPEPPDQASRLANSSSSLPRSTIDRTAPRPQRDAARLGPLLATPPRSSTMVFGPAPRIFMMHQRELDELRLIAAVMRGRANHEITRRYLADSPPR
jgi:hypothetical protein